MNPDPVPVPPSTSLPAFRLGVAVLSLVAAGSLSSCIHLKPANREFQTDPAFAYDETFQAGAEGLTAEKPSSASRRIRNSSPSRSTASSTVRSSRHPRSLPVGPAMNSTSRWPS